MFKKRSFVMMAIIIIIIVMQLTIGFYSIPFVKANNLLNTANNRTLAEIADVFKEDVEKTYISKEHYEKMRVVKGDLADNEYVELKLKSKINFSNLTTINMTCNVRAIVYLFDETKFLREYNDVLTVTFTFQGGHWKVTNVD